MSDTYVITIINKELDIQNLYFYFLRYGCNSFKAVLKLSAADSTSSKFKAEMAWRACFSQSLRIFGS